MERISTKPAEPIKQGRFYLNVRFWPIADVRPNDPAQAMLMSGFDPNRTFGGACAANKKVPVS